MSWFRRSRERLTGAPPPVKVEPAQEATRRRIDAIQLHATHASLGRELAPRLVEDCALDVAAFVSARDYRSATSNVLVLPELVGGAVLLAVFEGNYKSSATALACSLVASALCDGALAATAPFDDARADVMLREAFTHGRKLLAALAEAGPPDDVWDDFVRAEVLGSRAEWGWLGCSVTAVLVAGSRVTVAHVGENEAHRVDAEGRWTRMTASHMLIDDARYAAMKERSLLEGVVARIVTAEAADLDVSHSELASDDTLFVVTPSVARGLGGGGFGVDALADAARCLELAQAEPIPAAAVVARLR